MQLLLAGYRVLMVTHSDQKVQTESQIKTAIEHMIAHPDTLLFAC